MSEFKNIEIPVGTVEYPEELNKERDELIRKFEEEKKNPNVRTRLTLVAEAFLLFGKQVTYESDLKTKALAHTAKNRLVDQVGRDRLLESGVMRRLTDGES